jgi:hypothetical protein
MKIKLILGIMLAMGVFAMSGCGGGGGGGGAGPTTTITGVASKGIFVSGIVKVFALNTDGSKGALLTTADIQPDGTYTAIISYTGPVVCEASGKYKDEASGGAVLEIPPGTPLRAVVSNATAEVKVAITALTEIAVQTVETGTGGNARINTANIDSANRAVANTFHVADILTTQPIDPLAATAATATDDQKQYALALAAVSQIMHDSSHNENSQKFQDAIAVVKAIVDSNSTQAAQTFQTALQTFASDTGKNQTGITDITATPLVNVGGTTATVKLKTVGSATNLNGIQVTLTLPEGVTVKADSGIPKSGLVALSGVVSGSSLLETHYLPAATKPATLIMALASKDSFSTGEFVTIKCDVAAGKTLTSASLSYSGGKVVDGVGAVINGITFAADVQ